MTAPTPTPPLSRGRRIRRFVLRRVVFFGMVYFGVVIVFMFLESMLVFRPDSAQQSWFPSADERIRDVSFHAADGVRIHSWWLPPDKSADGAFLVAHGNGGNVSHRGSMAVELRKATGAGVLLFDYPGYGKSEGKPTEAGCYAAGDAAYRWLTNEAKVPANRIVLMGESLGGGTAVELATRHDHRAIVLVFTFASLPAAAKHHYRWLPIQTLMRTRFDNLSKIGRCRRPVFIFHGTADEVVPFAHGEALFAAANEPKEFVRAEGFSHNLFLGERFFVPLARFLDTKAP